MEESLLLKLHEWMVGFYALSVLLYYYDFLQNKRKVKRIALILLCIVWLMQTGLLILYITETGRFPILSMAEGLYFYSWLLITCSILLNVFVKVEFIIFFTSVLGFIMNVIYTFAPFHWNSPALAEKLISELLFAHITLSLVAYVLFSLSFLFSLLYIVQHQLLKRKKWGGWLFRINDLSKLEGISFRLNFIGVPFFFIGVILGLQWLYLQLPGVSILDLKILGSFLVITMYSCFLFLKMKRGMFGKNLALLNIASFLIVLINYFLLGRFSDFHFWVT